MDNLPKGMLLDLDDTILAFDTVSDESWEITLQEFRHRLLPVDPSSLHTAIKASAKHFWSDPARHQAGRMNLLWARTTIVTDAMAALNLHNPDLVDAIAQVYETIRIDRIHPVDGALDTLEALRQRQVRLVLVTNGDAPGQRRKIDRFHLQPFFDAILIEGECGVGKPDERIYQKALDALKLHPEDVWMVGDNLEWEVRGPQKLGIRGVWVDYRGIGLPADGPAPYKVIRSLRDILP
jgi:putative hydrolase of the HAD superfamily